MKIETTDASPAALGFLSVIELPSQGLIGGYLLLNAHARPLEFHCTAPVRANRAQEVLYGATLEPYLYGEQIGATLIKASRLSPLAVFTDCQPALAAADHILAPLWWVIPRPAGVEGEKLSIPNKIALPPGEGRARALHTDDRTVPTSTAISSEPSAPVRCGDNVLVPAPVSKLPARLSAESLEQRLPEFAATIDLLEPFERIRAAIQESQRGWR